MAELFDEEACRKPDLINGGPDLKKMKQKNYTYILRCGDDSLYTGWTNDIKKRLAVHQSGHGAKYTRGRGPLALVYLEVFDTKQEAMSREAQIKHLTRARKLTLIEELDDEMRQLMHRLS